MRYFDAHTHVNFSAYNEDRAEVIARAKEAEIGMNVVGTQFDTSRSAVELAEKYENVWATVGLHPIHTTRSYHDEKELGPSFAEVSEGKEGFVSRGEQFDILNYETLARKSKKVIAIGECGLDYCRVDKGTKEVQVQAFVEQIELANRLQKPLMLHIRDAYDDALEIVRTHATVQGDVHFFAGDWGVAKQFLELGFTLSFTGVITFTQEYDEVIRSTPLDMLLTETDAPYVTPVPHRGKRNEPSYVSLVVRRMAQIKGVEEEEMRSRAIDTAARVFSIA